MNRSLFEFDRYDVYAIRDYGDYAQEAKDDKHATFYGLYGWVESGGFYVAIGDYTSRFDAEIVADVLNDKKRGIPPIIIR